MKEAREENVEVPLGAEEMPSAEQEEEQVSLPASRLKDLLLAVFHHECDWCELPAPLQNDREVVLASVAGGFACWIRLPERWKFDPEVLSAALRGQPPDAKPLFSCMWHTFPEHIQTNPDVITTALETETLGWTSIPTELVTRHSTIALFGVQNSLVDAEDFPCLNRDFLKTAIERGKLSWHLLPRNFQHDIGFVRSLSSFASHHVPCAIFRQFPSLCRDPTFWLQLMAGLERSREDMLNDRHTPLFILMERDFAQEICSNHEVMVKACHLDKFILEYMIHPSLLASRQFLVAVLEDYPHLLVHLSHETQKLFPEVIRQSFAPLGNHSKLQYDLCSHIAARMAPELWEDRDFSLSWFGAGLPFVEEVFAASWKDDKEIFLLVAEYCRVDLQPLSFTKASLSLRGDQQFMKQVLERAPALLSCASERLKQDFNLMTLAFAAEPLDVVHALLRGYAGQKNLVHDFCHEVELMLQRYETFTATILFGISTSDSGSPLSILNQGTETSVVYKKLISQYLDVPTGKQLRLMRKARSNMMAIQSGDH